MPLIWISQPGNEPDTKIDIITVPAIGADPVTTWSYPSSSKGEPYRSLYSNVNEARVFHYAYPSLDASASQAQYPDTLKPTGSTLLDVAVLKETTPSGEAPYPNNQEDNVPLSQHGLDFYASDLLQCLRSLVSKGQRPFHFAAHSTGGLVLKKALVAARASGDKTSGQVASSCFAVAFFGVPHYGSTVLSDDIYQRKIERLMNLEPSMGAQLRKELKPNAAGLMQLNQQFASLALLMRKIWAFVEAIETKFEILSSSATGETLTSVKIPVVDIRSATLSSETLRIGSEEEVKVHSDHARLSRFGDDATALAYKNYIDELCSMIAGLALDGEQDPAWIVWLVEAEVHAFYDGGESVTESTRLWSTKTPLQRLLEKGPAECLKQGLESIEDEAKNTQESRPSSISEVKFVIPTITLTTPTPDEHEAQRELGELETNEQHNSSNDAPPSADRASQDGGPDAVGGSSKDSGLRQTAANHRKPATLVLPPRRRITSEENTKKQSLFHLPDLSHARFRWIHIPTNNMFWVPKVLQTIAEEKNEKSLHINLLNRQVWDSKQNIARHGAPHSRFMHPTCYFHSTRSERPVAARGKPTSQSSTDGLQLSVYFPYLHWDTFNNLRATTEVIKKRMLQKDPHPLNEGVASGISTEHKLIWQYLTSPVGLPLHHRRSLDQYGYPNLRDTSTRDADQILYKRTRPAWDFQPSDPEAAEDSHLVELLKQERRVKGQPQRSMWGEVLSPANEDESKVLMIDQLWCWVVDDDTVVTFFPAKEEGQGDASSKLADLRNAIHNDVNGDPLFAKQCHDCFDFAALAIYNAVTVFLENTSDTSLQVFRIFEEYISELTEKQTMSFQQFRSNQMKDISTDTSEEAVERLGHNSDDLSALLELRDIEDELGTLDKLFNEQLVVLKQLRSNYEAINAKKSRQSKGLIWLEDAADRIESYQFQVSTMRASCSAGQEAYKYLLDMRQKQANVDEAVLARKSTEVAATQGRAVMIFTVFTIIFLPLSFFTSLFGMNAREWVDDPDTSLTLHKMLALMLPISAVVIILALLLAFSSLIRSTVVWVFTQSWRVNADGHILPLWRGDDRRAEKRNTRGGRRLSRRSQLSPRMKTRMAVRLPGFAARGRKKSNLD